MGRADYLAPGDWNVMCYRCGRKRKASTMRRYWSGEYFCPEHWEPRQPQDFVRAIPDNPNPPWTQPWPADDLTYGCDFLDRTALPGIGTAGCVVSGYVYASWGEMLANMRYTA